MRRTMGDDGAFEGDYWCADMQSMFHLFGEYQSTTLYSLSGRT